MPRHRTTPRRRSRKQLEAELQRLSVPARDEQPNRRASGTQANPSPGSAEPKADDEHIRRMIEAAYT